MSEPAERDAMDLAAYTDIVAVLAFVSAVATWLPARRAGQRTWQGACETSRETQRAAAN